MLSKISPRLTLIAYAVAKSLARSVLFSGKEFIALNGSERGVAPDSEVDLDQSTLSTHTHTHVHTQAL